MHKILPVILVGGIAAVLGFSIFNPQSQGKTKAASSSAFLTISGSKFSYNGNTVVLKGINFDNVRALDAGIGTGNVNDIAIGEADYQLLSSYGANVVRFGMAFSWYKNQKTAFFNMLDQHIAWAKKHNLWLILNMFTTPGSCYEGYGNYCNIWFDQNQLDALQNFWVEVATRYKDEPVIAGYDLLNEPTPPAPGWSKTWFDYAQILRDAISEVDSNHFVIIESTSDPVFTRVFRGSNIVYSVHDYTPLSLTHVNANSGRTYPGNAPAWNGTNVYWDKNAFAGGGSSLANLQQVYPIKWARDRNLPLLIGEWGSRGTYDGYVQYIRDHAELYNDWGVHHTYYTWRHDPDNWKWGVFPPTGALNTYDQDKLDAIKVSWQGSVKPNFAGSSVTTSQSNTSQSTPVPDTGSTSSTTQTNTSSATAPPIAAIAAPSVIRGITGTYYSSKDFSLPVFTRTDSTVNFNWNYGPPDRRLPWDNYSIEWNGKLKAPKTGTYTIFTHSDDGVRVWLNDQLIIDNWSEHAFVENRATVSLQEGQVSSLKIRYFESVGQAGMKLWWQPPGGTKAIVPATALAPDGSGAAKQTVAGGQQGLKATYFASKDLTSKKFDRIDPTINFNWNFGAPVSTMGRDNYSIEWTGSIEAPYSGSYTFYTHGDDGVRLWIDNQLIIDDWRDHAFVEKYNKVTLQAGKRYPIKMQYYENRGMASVKLWWQHQNIAKQIIPSKYLFTQ